MVLQEQLGNNRAEGWCRALWRESKKERKSEVDERYEGDGLDPEDMAIPVIKLVQNVGGEIAKDLGAKPGNFYCDLTGEIMEGYSMIIIKMMKDRTFWGRIEIDEDPPECSSMNAKSMLSNNGDDCNTCEHRNDTPWLTKQHYKKHLEGKESLGVYMLQDDATCWFFALDLDEKNISKALKIREAFGELHINSYLAFSKSKGFHCYVFADEEPFKAREVRRLCHAVLAKVDIQCEVFPKQDELDEQTSVGSYINLPSFGSSRMFFGASKTAIDIAQALQRIRRVSRAKIAAAMKAIPAPPKPTILKAKKGRPKKKSKSPPCIDVLLKGTPTGSRDQAAFALARHFLAVRIPLCIRPCCGWESSLFRTLWWALGDSNSRPLMCSGQL